jgi:hypothetical protein
MWIGRIYGAMQLWLSKVELDSYSILGRILGFYEFLMP